MTEPAETLRAEIRNLPELATLGPEKRDSAAGRITRIMTQSVKHSTFKGPIAPPELMAEYALVDPALPGRIVAMAETSQQRVEDRADKKLYYDHFYRMSGLFLGFAALTACVVGGVTLLIYEYQKAGLALLSVGFIAPIAKVFIDGRLEPKAPNGNDKKGS